MRRFATINVASCYGKIVYVQSIVTDVVRDTISLTSATRRQKLKGWRSAGAVQAVSNDPSTSAAQSTTVGGVA